MATVGWYDGHGMIVIWNICIWDSIININVSNIIIIRLIWIQNNVLDILAKKIRANGLFTSFSLYFSFTLFSKFSIDVVIDDDDDDDHPYDHNWDMRDFQ